MTTPPVPNTTPQNQFLEEVLPSYLAYMADKNCQWKARCATYMLAHFAEHVWYYYRYHEDEEPIGGRKKAKTFVTYLTKKFECPELEMVWETAVVSKHRFPFKPDKLRRKNEGPQIYVSGSRTHVQTTATNAFSSETVVGSTGSVLPGREADGLRMPQYDRRADDVLEKVASFWIEWLRTAPVHTERP